MNTPTKGSVRTMDAAFQKLLDADTHPENISDALKRNAPMAPGPTLVPVKRYTSRVYHELEKTHLWKKSWQMACHEDDFKNVGDAVPYDITTMSFLIVKVSEESTKRITTRAYTEAVNCVKTRGDRLMSCVVSFTAGLGILMARLSRFPVLMIFRDLNAKKSRSQRCALRVGDGSFFLTRTLMGSHSNRFSGI